MLRTLEYDITRQKITRTAGCDFTGLAPGTKGYLKVKFHTITDEWIRCEKFAVFYIDDIEICDVKLDKDDACIVPDYITAQKEFYIALVGKNDDFQIKTSQIRVKQNAKIND